MEEDIYFFMFMVLEALMRNIRYHFYDDYELVYKLFQLILCFGPGS